MEKKSSFQAHMCRVVSMDEVQAFRSTLLQDKRVRLCCLVVDGAAIHKLF